MEPSPGVVALLAAASRSPPANFDLKGSWRDSVHRTAASPTNVKTTGETLFPRPAALPRRLPRVTAPLREMEPKLLRLFPVSLAASRMPFAAIVSRANAAPYFRFIAIPQVGQ